MEESEISKLESIKDITLKDYQSLEAELKNLYSTNQELITETREMYESSKKSLEEALKKVEELENILADIREGKDNANGSIDPMSTNMSSPFSRSEQV